MSVLFTPGTIGNMELKNRFVRSATVECLCSDDGRVTEAYLKVCERLAKGGVALILPGSYSVNQLARAHPRSITADTDEVIGDLRKVADRVHPYGTKIVAQLNHRGRHANRDLTGSRPVAPSPVRVKPGLFKPRPMTTDEIERTITDFSDAAYRVREAGFDGVQIHAAHGYLINQFLSSYTNRRKDEWGGSLENRMRFLVETYRSIRTRVGADFPILVKINAEDCVEDGVTLDESISFCKTLDELGIAGIEVSGGIADKGLVTVRGDVPGDLVRRNRGFVQRLLVRLMENSMREAARFEEAYFLPHAAAIKKHVKAPVIAVGGLRTPAVMEEAIRTGQADFVSLCRPFIRQPNLVNRMERGEADPISCTNCNRCTLEIVVHHSPLRCYYTPS